MNGVTVAGTIPPRPYGEDPALGRIMPAPATQADFCQPTDGYRGLWWGQTPTGDEYAFKYSGGLGTYPAQQRPIAIHAPAVQKTFFVYGGTTRDSHLRTADRESRWDFGPGELLQMVSYYDHRSGEVPRPVILFDKWTADPHDNPVLALDDAGHLWVFSPSHGPWTTRSFIHRSRRPYDITSFETVWDGGRFAYPQPWWLPGRGFAFFHTRYEEDAEGRLGRSLYFATSPDGGAWSPARLMARNALGHYQLTATRDGKLASVFDYHPLEGGLEARTNLYYLESSDGGATWTNAAGHPMPLPLQSVAHPARVRDFEREGQKVYLIDLVLDEAGHPVILFLTSSSHRPGPQQPPRRWTLARWTGESWRFLPAMTSDSNYDHGSLDLSDPSEWRLIAPTETGPQPFNPGGEVALWTSRNRGETWQRKRVLTAGSARNHTFVRRPLDAHPDFAAFWADGDARRPSSSSLYFADRDGTAVRVLPADMGNATHATPDTLPLPASVC